jgi:hypothetical protein
MRTIALQHDAATLADALTKIGTFGRTRLVVANSLSTTSSEEAVAFTDRILEVLK